MSAYLSIYRSWDQPLELWDSKARGVVIDALMRAKQNADLSRRELWQALHGFLDGDHRAELEARLRILYPKVAPQWNTSEAGHRYFPLIPMYADRLSVVFHRCPDTYLVDANGDRLEDEVQQDQWRQDVKDIKLGMKLQTLERWVNSGMGQALTQVVIRKDKIKWEVLAPYQVWVDQDPEEPSELDGAQHLQVILPQRNDSLMPGDAADDLYMTWQKVDARNEWGRITGTDWFCWLHDEAGGLKRNPLFPDNINRYGMHPFAVWRTAEPPSGDFWLEPNKGWYHQQLAADIKFCDLDHHLRHQIHSQMLAKGIPRSEMETGPDRALHTMETDASLEFVTPDPRLELLIDGFNFDLRASAVAESLPPDTWEPNSSTRNLAAKQLEQAALEVRRARVVPFYLDALAQTFEIHKAVGNFWANELNRTRYAEAVGLGVELAPIPKVVDRFQDTQANTIDIQQGVTSPVEIRMRREGITRQEAERRILVATGADKKAEGDTDAGQVVEVTEEAVLNGAQIKAASDIVIAVAEGLIPRNAGIGQLFILFNLSQEQAEAILGSAGTDAFTPALPDRDPAAAALAPTTTGQLQAGAAGSGVPRPPSVQG